MSVKATRITFKTETNAEAESASTTSNTAGQVTFTEDKIHLGLGNDKRRTYESININLCSGDINTILNPARISFPEDLWENITIDNLGNPYIRTIIANNPTKFVRSLTKHKDHIHFLISITKENYATLTTSEKTMMHRYFFRYPAISNAYSPNPTTPLPTNNLPLKYSGIYDISFQTGSLLTLKDIRDMLPLNSNLTFNELFTASGEIGNDRGIGGGTPSEQGGQASYSQWLSTSSITGSATMADTDVYQLLGRINGINCSKEQIILGGLFRYNGLSRKWLPDNGATYGMIMVVEIICKKWIPNNT